MTHETGTLRTADGLDLFTRRWTPDRGAVAVVALVHGVHEHSGRYAYLASALMRRGIAVHALDLRGHGQSPGERGQVEASFDEYVGDVARFLDETRAAAEGAPLFLMGHSMGGLVAAAVLVDRGTDGLAGVVLSSPALAVDAPALLRRAAPVVARFFPDAPVTRLDLSGLSRDPVVARAYREDPLTLNQGVRARLGHEIVRTAERVRQRSDAFDVPLYLFHGTADRLTSPEGTRWLAAHAASDDVTLRLYEGLYHETLNEPERDDVIGALADWLADRADVARGS
jgi:alpha-beta hydrolase superfamily lysophospholipase